MYVPDFCCLIRLLLFPGAAGVASVLPVRGVVVVVAVRGVVAASF